MSLAMATAAREAAKIAEKRMLIAGVKECNKLLTVEVWFFRITVDLMSLVGAVVRYKAVKLS